jgi:hypothetical protein
VADIQITVDQATAIARKAWNDHQMACRITTVSGSLEKVAIALRSALMNPDQDGMGQWQSAECAPFDREVIALWWGSPLYTETSVALRDSETGYWVNPDDRREVYGVPNLWMPWPELPPHPELAAVIHSSTNA